MFFGEHLRTYMASSGIPSGPPWLPQGNPRPSQSSKPYESRWRLLSSHHSALLARQPGHRLKGMPDKIHPSIHPAIPSPSYLSCFFNCPYQKEMTCGCPIHIVGLGCRYPPLKNPGLTLEIHTFVRDRRPLYSISCHDQRMVSPKIFHCRVIVPKWTM